MGNLQKNGRHSTRRPRFLVRQLDLIQQLTNLELAALRPQIPACFLMLEIGDMSNGETVFEVAWKHCGVSLASSFGITIAYCACVSGCSYLHQLHLNKMVTVKCNLKTSVTKRKVLNAA